MKWLKTFENYSNSTNNPYKLDYDYFLGTFIHFYDLEWLMRVDNGYFENGVFQDILPGEKRKLGYKVYLRAPFGKSLKDEDITELNYITEYLQEVEKLKINIIF